VGSGKEDVTVKLWVLELLYDPLEFFVQFIVTAGAVRGDAMLATVTTVTTMSAPSVAAAPVVAALNV